ncbi:M14-type cytosolic carboxypeptidase [Bowmanella denitrificans]|uniref:M14-type cytosolic carboxypeptidase n=1 Tax=Bowmanella denitrificans TaxID=366582 RepID=A0ABN0XRT3_9ALTE
MKYALILLLLSQLAFAETDCRFNKLSIDKAFAMGRFKQCQQLAPNRYKLTLAPENLPINPSPWYAFRLDSAQSQRIELELQTEHGTPRYLPKFSLDKLHWQPLEYQLEGNSMLVSMTLNKGQVWVAGQEILDNQHYQHWLSAPSFADLSEFELGRTVNGQPLQGLVHRGQSNEWLILIGRQHPPEITGAMAMTAFVDELFTVNSQSAKFLQHFNLLLVPNMNPDGVAAGNWRHNAGGVDLNRDWFSREQPETQAVHQYLQQIQAQGGKIRFAVDFHSTHKDVFYTMPADYGLASADLAERWLTGLADKVKPFPIRIQPGHNKNRGVFKQYIADTYAVHAVTYEVGDNTDRQDIQLVARAAAQELMQLLLAN